MNNINNISNDVYSVIANQMKICDQELKNEVLGKNDNFKELFGFGDIEESILINSIEHKFNIKIEEKEYVRLNSVNKIIRIVKDRIN